MDELASKVTCDFGMDLAACLELFQKPMAMDILPILEEETNKASVETLEAKLTGDTWLCSIKNSRSPDKNDHFAVVLYAGTVSHNVTGWLNKNRDPFNDTVVYLLKKSKTCTLMCKVNMDRPS